MADKKATRESYGTALAELGEKYDFLVLDADGVHNRHTRLVGKFLNGDAFFLGFVGPDRLTNMDGDVGVFLMPEAGKSRTFAEGVADRDDRSIVLIGKGCRPLFEGTDRHVVVPKPRFGIDVHPLIAFVVF